MTHSELRVGIVIPGIPASSTGPSICVAMLARTLCDIGCTVTVITGDLVYRGGPKGATIPIDYRAQVKSFEVRSNLQRKLYRSGEMSKWLQTQCSKLDVVDIQGVWS